MEHQIHSDAEEEKSIESNSKPFLMMVYTVLSLMVVAICLKECHISPLESQVYRVKNGYGYTITKDGEFIVRQEYIPGNKTKVFCDSIDAVKVSTEVMYRIFSGEPEQITEEDLIKLDVKTKC